MITNHPVALQSLLALHHARYGKHRLIKAVLLPASLSTLWRTASQLLPLGEKRGKKHPPASSLSALQLVEWRQISCAHSRRSLRRHQGGKGTTVRSVCSGGGVLFNGSNNSCSHVHSSSTALPDSWQAPESGGCLTCRPAVLNLGGHN